MCLWQLWLEAAAQGGVLVKKMAASMSANVVYDGWEYSALLALFVNYFVCDFKCTCAIQSLSLSVIPPQ